MAFAQPVFWNVRWLIQSVNPSNYRQNLSELDALIHPNSAGGLVSTKQKQGARADVLAFFFRTILDDLKPDTGRAENKDQVWFFVPLLSSTVHSLSSPNPSSTRLSYIALSQHRSFHSARPPSQTKVQLLRSYLKDQTPDWSFAVLIRVALDGGEAFPRAQSAALCELGEATPEQKVAIAAGLVDGLISSDHAFSERVTGALTEAREFLRTALEEWGNSMRGAAGTNGAGGGGGTETFGEELARKIADFSEGFAEGASWAGLLNVPKGLVVSSDGKLFKKFFFCGPPGGRTAASRTCLLQVFKKE